MDFYICHNSYWAYVTQVVVQIKENGCYFFIGNNCKFNIRQIEYVDVRAKYVVMQRL